MRHLSNNSELSLPFPLKDFGERLVAQLEKYQKQLDSAESHAEHVNFSFNTESNKSKNKKIKHKIKTHLDC